jgi:hypothetical protein
MLDNLQRSKDYGKDIVSPLSQESSVSVSSQVMSHLHRRQKVLRGLCLTTAKALGIRAMPDLNTLLCVQIVL